jgi:hypothetical protein
MRLIKKLFFRAKVAIGPAGVESDGLQKFFAVVRENFGKLSQGQVDGFQSILAKFNEHDLDARWRAYMLATAWHETARTMKPVSEYGSQRYLRSKPYWPYFGRGYVQLTWRRNYEKYGIELTPERALEPEMAAHIMIDGMVKGVFTGHKLTEYFNTTRNNTIGARHVINGSNKALKIAGYHDIFFRALLAQG